MNIYEALYILDPNIEEEQTQAEIESILSDVREKGGEILSTQDVGRKQLAYTIKKRDEGRYVLIYIKIDGKALDSIKAKYKLDQRILRYMILRIKEEQMLLPQDEI